MECVICSKEFSPRNTRSVYCSKGCQRKGKLVTTRLLRRKRAKDATPIQKKCIVCGKIFEPSKYAPSVQVYCSSKCSSYLRHQREKSTGLLQERNKIYRKEHAEEIAQRDKYYRERMLYDGKREEVLKRDCNKCVMCGDTEKLAVHHIDKTGYSTVKDYEQINNDLENLITLCMKCHRKQHREMPSNYKDISKEQMLYAICHTKTYDEASKQLGIHSRSFYRKLDRYGISYKQRKVSYEQAKDAIDTTKTLDEAAKKLGISKFKLQAKQREYGLMKRKIH